MWQWDASLVSCGGLRVPDAGRADEIWALKEGTFEDWLVQEILSGYAQPLHFVLQSRTFQAQAGCCA